MQKIFFHLALFLTLTLPATAVAETWRLTLEQAVERGLQENRDISVVRERLAELEGMKGEARSEGLPHLNSTVEYQRMWRKPKMNINGQFFTVGTKNNYTASAGVDQLLWDGGRVIKAVKAARTELARGIENIRDAEAVVRFQVKETYYEILYMDKVIDVFDRELKQLRVHLGSIQTRFNQGIDSDYTLMRQQVQVSNIEPQIIDAKRNRELLKNGLKILLAIPPADEMSIAGEFDYHTKPMPDIAELAETAKSRRPDLLAERLRQKSLEQNVGIEKAGYWPKLNLNVFWAWQGQSDTPFPSSNEITDTLNSAFTLTWPIFDGLKTHSRVQQAKAKLMQQQYMTSELEDSVIRDVKDALETLVRARESLASQEKSLSLAKKSTAIAGERFEAGLMSQIELNDTINAQATAEQNYLRAAFDCMTAEAALEKATGGEL
ncbi:MAG: TolC family protein [bacterium]